MFISCMIICSMKKRKKPKATDLNLIAKTIADADTHEKIPDAVTIGRIGGKKGGKSRAKKLTPEQSSEIAKIAAQARWKKTDNDQLAFLFTFGAFDEKYS